MRIYWWQGGVFLHPETKPELHKLGKITNSVKTGLDAQATAYSAEVIATAEYGKGGTSGLPPELIDDEDES